MDLSTLSHDELAAHIRAGILEAETRAASHANVLKWIEAGHACLNRAAKAAVAGGQVSTDSVGGDKD